MKSIFNHLRVNKNYVLSFHVLLFKLILFSAEAIAQTDSLVISGKFLGNPAYTYLVVQGYGKALKNQQTVSIENEQFRVALPADAPKGMYRLMYDPIEYKYFDVIINGEKEIKLKYDLSKMNPELSFQASDENIIWLDFQKKTGNQYTKLGILGNVLANYPDKNHSFVVEAKQLYDKEKNVLLENRNSFLTKNTNNIAGVLAKNTAPKFQNPTDHPRVQAYLAQQTYWDGIDTNNDTLLQTPLYQELIIGYLKYYMSSGVKYTESELDEGLITSAKVIFERFTSPAAKTFAMDLLTQVFKERGDEKPLKFVDEYRSQQETCATDSPDAKLAERIDAYKRLQAGMPAPELKLIHPQTKQSFGLKDISEDRILLIFWGSGCEHCQKTMPLVAQDNLTQYGIAPIAIGIENNPEAYNKAIEPLNNMFHSTDFLAWDSPNVKAYHIVATPSFILLDKDRKIIGKYSSYEGVKNALK
jgi:thiol-disulfide isomerase/thioredoxin